MLLWAFSSFEGFPWCFTSHVGFGCKEQIHHYCFAPCLHVNTQDASAWISFAFKILKISWASSLAGSRNVSRAWVAPGKMRFGTWSFSPKYFMTLFTGSSYLHLDSFLLPYIHHFQALSVSGQSRVGVGGRGDSCSGFPSCRKAGAGLRGGVGVRRWIPGFQGWISKYFFNQCCVLLCSAD